MSKRPGLPTMPRCRPQLWARGARRSSRASPMRCRIGRRRPRRRPGLLQRQPCSRRGPLGRSRWRTEGRVGAPLPW
eukprot:90521-Alexandrium_andersonii.AAC.1